MKFLLSFCSLSVIVAATTERGSTAAAGWMGTNWDKIKDLTIANLTLPGSHNSGNIAGELNADNLCKSDYKYYDRYISQVTANKITFLPLTQKEFDDAFIPWNINHDISIEQQLLRGIRWFHLKVCQMGSDPSNLDEFVHYHRGYTTSESLLDTISTMKQFISQYPNEIVVIGLNNIGFSNAEVDASASLDRMFSALSEEFGSDVLITNKELHEKPLVELINSGKRVAVFVKTSSGMMLSHDNLDSLGLIPSNVGLIENWDDDAMGRGNVTAAMEWLHQDLVQNAVRNSTKFYVMQANPNNGDNEEVQPNIFTLISNGFTPSSGYRPHSLKQWISSFLIDIPKITAQAREEIPDLRINAISTDFIDTSDPVTLALEMMGLTLDDQCGTARSSSASTKLHGHIIGTMMLIVVAPHLL